MLEMQNKLGMTTGFPDTGFWVWYSKLKYRLIARDGSTGPNLNNHASTANLVAIPEINKSDENETKLNCKRIAFQEKKE